MTSQEVLTELQSLGSEQTKKTLMRHGAREPFFGVKVEHLKKIQKKIKHNHALSLDLYDTGNSDAMYLAGLISEPAKMTRAQLKKWVKGAYWYMLANHTVPAAAAESPFALELAREWIESPKEMIASAGWATLSAYVAITPDEQLDLAELEALLDRVRTDIVSAMNYVRYTMNGYVIAIGAFVPALLEKAKATARALGKVEVDMGDTSCKVPDAFSYIEKIEKMGRVGKKRKTAFC